MSSWHLFENVRVRMTVDAAGRRARASGARQCRFERRLEFATIRSGSKLEYREVRIVTRVGWPFMARSITRPNRREWSRSRHDHDGPKLMLVAPGRKHLTFALGSSVGPGYAHDVGHAEPLQLANLPSPCILVGESSPDEFVIFSTRGIGENRNSRRDAALHEVRCFERPGTAGVSRYDDDIGGRDGIVDDERPSCGPQDRLTKRGDSNDGSSGQRDRYQDPSISGPPETHLRIHLQMMHTRMECNGIEPL